MGIRPEILVYELQHFETSFPYWIYLCLSTYPPYSISISSYDSYAGMYQKSGHHYKCTMYSVNKDIFKKCYFLIQIHILTYVFKTKILG